MKIRWLEDALFDLRSLRSYIAQDNPTAANRIATTILKAVNLLTEQPGMSRPGRVHNTRELIITNTPYIVPYRVNNNIIEILRVYHAALQWPEHF